MLSLENKIVITTQPADQAMKLSDLLKSKGAKVFNIPMVKTFTLKLSPEQVKDCLMPDKYSHIIFTSRKGVKGYFDNLIEHKGSASLPTGLKISVIGESTKKEVENYGHKVDFINPGTDVKAFTDYLLEKVISLDDNVTLAVGTLAPDYLYKALSAKAKPIRINVYETLPVEKADENLSEYIISGKADMCVFTSPSAFYNFLRFFEKPEGISLAAIGTTTSNVIEQSGCSVQVIAPYPSVESMADAIEKYFTNL